MWDGDLVEEAVTVCRESYALRLTPGTSGNLSFRRGRFIMISGSGLSLGFIDARGFVDGATASDLPLAPVAPSSEYPLHAAIYGVMPECRAILHFHGPWVLQAGVREQPRQWVPRVAPPEFGQLAPDGWLPRVPFLPPGSEELGEAVAEAVRDGAMGAILCRHGGVALGRSPREALFRAEAMESAAHLDYFARLAGQHEERSGAQ